MLELVIILIIMALIMEIVDSSLGMMYGTLLSPVLIGAGFEPLVVVPAIVISQALGGIAGTVSHQKFKNVDFNGFTRDTKIALAMVIPGLIVVVLGVIAATNLPKEFVKIYIGILVVTTSVLCLSPLKYKFAWWKHFTVGVLAAFNKSLSGGGFGPVTSTGGIIGGLEPKVSIATTTFAEVGICFASFVAYLFFVNYLDLLIIGPLCIGAFMGGLFGPYLGSKIGHSKLRISIGILGIASGIWLLWDVLVH